MIRNCKHAVDSPSKRAKDLFFAVKRKKSKIIFPRICVTSYATVNITCFEITANSEIHTNKPGKPAVYTSDKIKADLAEAKVITLSIRAKGRTLPVR